MRFSDLFRKGLNSNFKYDSRDEEFRAGRRVADDMNNSHRPGPGVSMAGSHFIANIPGSRFMAGDDKGFLHSLKIGEDGKVYHDEEIRDRMENFLEESKRAEKEHKREKQMWQQQTHRQAGLEAGQRQMRGLLKNMPAEGLFELPESHSGPSFGGGIARLSWRDQQQAKRQEAIEALRSSQRSRGLQQQQFLPFGAGVGARDFQQGSQPELRFQQPSQMLFQQQSMHFQPQQSPQFQQRTLPFQSQQTLPFQPQHSLPFQPQQQPSQPQFPLQPPAPPPPPQNAPSFVDPLITSHLPIGARGQRKYVPGQSKLDPRQFGPLNDPDANYKHLKALEELRKKNGRNGRGGR